MNETGNVFEERQLLRFVETMLRSLSEDAQANKRTPDAADLVSIQQALDEWLDDIDPSFQRVTLKDVRGQVQAIGFRIAKKIVQSPLILEYLNEIHLQWEDVENPLYTHHQIVADTPQGELHIFLNEDWSAIDRRRSGVFQR